MDNENVSEETQTPSLLSKALIVVGATTGLLIAGTFAFIKNRQPSITDEQIQDFLASETEATDTPTD